MSKGLSAWVGLGALVAVALAAGCGDSGSSGTSETAATTEAAQTITTAANERLTSAQWAEYESSRAALRKANTTATATLKKCSEIANQQKPAAVQACVGDTFTQLTTVAGDSLSTLKGFQSSVSGTCASALDNLINQVGVFQASASQMQATIDSSTLAGYPAASQNLELALTSGRTEATTFEQECAPS